MKVEDILKELEPYTGRFPKCAMKEAVKQQEAITPELLRVVEAVAANPVEFAARGGYMLHKFAIYLLAQFREKRAYRSIVGMFSAPGETSIDLGGDTVYEALNRIFGSVYDGDPGPLQQLIEDNNVNEYVRDAALSTFPVLVKSGQMAREDAVSYYRSLFQGKLERTPNFTWCSLVMCVTNMPAPELIEEARRAVEEGLAEELFFDREAFDRRMMKSNSNSREDRHDIITDAIEEMEWWAAFDPKESRPRKYTPPPPPVAPSILAVSASSSRAAKIGRNEPCLCGSGKKYKKCCGGN